MGPASSLGGSPRGWLPTSSQPGSTFQMCPCWRVVRLPTGSSACPPAEHRSTGCKHGEKSPQACPHCPSPAPHHRRRCHAQAQLAQGWSRQRQDSAGRGVLAALPAGSSRAADAHTVVQWVTCTELMAAGLALLFTCRGSAAGALGASAFVPMPQAGRSVPVSGKGSWVRPVAQSSLPVGKAGREPWESTRRDGCHGSQCQ